FRAPLPRRRLVGGPALAALGGAGPGTLETWYVPQAEQTHDEADGARPDPPLAARRQVAADDQQHNKGDGPSRRDDAGDQLIVRLQRWRRLRPFFRHAIKITLTS